MLSALSTISVYGDEEVHTLDCIAGLDLSFISGS